MARIKSYHLSKELKKIGSLATSKEVGDMLKKLSIDAFQEVMLRSAVDTGFLRSNWDATTETPSSGVIRDVEGGAFNDASWPFIKIKAGDKVSIFNNTEYALYLETGTATMRAQPMIQPTYYRVLLKAKQLVRTLSKKKVS